MKCTIIWHKPNIKLQQLIKYITESTVKQKINVGCKTIEGSTTANKTALCYHSGDIQRTLTVWQEVRRLIMLWSNWVMWLLTYNLTFLSLKRRLFCFTCRPNTEHMTRTINLKQKGRHRHRNTEKSSEALYSISIHYICMYAKSSHYLLDWWENIIILNQ